MRSAAAWIFDGHVEHVRSTPCVHGFRTPVHFYAFDLGRLDEVDREVKGFGWNRFAPVSVRNRDYLSPGDGELREKLEPWRGGGASPHRIWLITSARWLGYVFNPVSFYLLENEAGELFHLVAEVNNTFGDRHVYSEPLEPKDGLLGAEHAKEFHVSPFNNMEGSYQFTVRRDGKELYIGVDLYRDGEKILEAWMEGTGESLTSKTLLRNALRHPFRPWLTMPRIVWQAVLLKFKRKLPVFKRPEPRHEHTIRSRNQPVNP
jgi:DUF1365 family protein